MSKPHKCPACDGKTDAEAKNCPGCGGTRVVWETEEAGVGSESPLEITGL